MKAIWNDTVIADSDDTVVVEGNHYFPASALEQAYVEPTEHHTVCPWKGTASYYDVLVDGARAANAAWYYPEPLDGAEQVADRVAFWNGVEVVA